MTIYVRLQALHELCCRLEEATTKLGSELKRLLLGTAEVAVWDGDAGVGAVADSERDYGWGRLFYYSTNVWI